MCRTRWLGYCVMKGHEVHEKSLSPFSGLDGELLASMSRVHLLQMCMASPSSSSSAKPHTRHAKGKSSSAIGSDSWPSASASSKLGG